MAEYSNNQTRAIYPVISTTGGKAQLTAVDIAFRQWVRATDEQRQKQYQTFRDYYEGDHPTMLTERLKKFLEYTNNTFNFRANYMAIPVDITAERMKVTGFRVIGEPEKVSDNIKQGGEDGRLWQWWNYNRMDEEQNNIHSSSLRDGDAYTLVEWDSDNEMPRIHHHLAFDGSSGMGVVYDEADKRQKSMAFKQWRVESGDDMGEMRRNLYYPGEVQKYISGGSGWELVDVVRWTDNGQLEGTPIGVPVFHYRNNGGGYDYGRSELHDLIPLQDSLNKAIIDLLASADASAFPEKVFEGGDNIAPPANIKFGPGGLLWGGKWYNIEPGDLSQLMTLIHDTVTRMAQISRTPLQYYQVTGQIASDDTQRAGDTGLVSKIENRSVSFGNTWEDVMYFCRRLHNIFGTGAKLPDYPISTEWGSFERVDRATVELKRSEIVANLVSSGASLYGAAKAAGYTDDEIKSLLHGDMPDGITQGSEELQPNLGEGLTGVAGKTTVEILQALAASQITKTTAVEMLVGFGFSREVAERMADAEIFNSKAALVAEKKAGITTRGNDGSA